MRIRILHLSLLRRSALHMYSICPISPDRIILLVYNGVLGAPYMKTK